MHQIDNLRHGGLLAALCTRRVRKLDCFAIAQQTTGQQQIVYIRRRRLEIVRLHSSRGGTGVVGGRLQLFTKHGLRLLLPQRRSARATTCHLALLCSLASTHPNSHPIDTDNHRYTNT